MGGWVYEASKRRWGNGENPAGAPGGYADRFAPIDEADNCQPSLLQKPSLCETAPVTATCSVSVTPPLVAVASDAQNWSLLCTFTGANSLTTIPGLAWCIGRGGVWEGRGIYIYIHTYNGYIHIKNKNITCIYRYTYGLIYKQY